MNRAETIAEYSFPRSSHFEFWTSMILGILLLSGFSLLSRVNFLLFHVLIELFSVVIMLAIFLLVWNTRNIIDNHLVLFLGIGFFFIGLVDILHIVSYKGMGIFPENDSNLPTQFWIIGRYLQSTTFFVAPFLLKRQFKPSLVMLIFTGVTTILIVAVFSGTFPDCFVQGSGLTAFKKNSEYLICLILIAAMWQFSRLREQLEPQILQFILISLSASVLSELFFTFYVSVYGLSNVVGHGLKIIAMLFLYKALIRSTIKNPFNLIFRELKANEQALLVSEKRFSRMFQEHEAIMLLIQPNTGEILEANSAAIKFYGYTYKQLCEMTIQQINTLPNDEIALLRLQALENKQNYFVFSHRLASGEIREVEVHSSEILSQEEKILFSIIHDVTGRKKIERALLKSESRYRSLIETQTDLVCRFTPDGTFVFVNDVYCNFFNLTRKELIGSKWQLLQTDSDVELMNKKLSELSRKKPTVIVETKVRTINGEIHWIHIINSGVFDSQGNLQEIQSVGRNITERRHTEMLLRQSNKLLEASQSIALVGGWELDLTTNNLFWTDETYRIHDTSPAEFNPTVDAGVSYFLPESRRIISEALQAAKERGEGYDLVLETLTTKGRRIDVRTTCEVTHHEGRPTKLTGIFQDITERKHVEEEKQRLEAQLQQAQKMESIGTLAGGIAHDFNNILSSVIGFTELALDTVDKGNPIADDLHEVYSAGLRAKDLVHQILTFARQSDEKFTPIQVDFIIKEVLKFIRSSIPTTIEIKQNIESDSLVMGNSTQIHRVMMNLCTNAAHSMENEGGTLEIAMKDITFDKTVRKGKSHLQRGNYIEIKVSDTGNGIDPQVIDKIFEPYFTTKETGEGTGMGLAMVHGIVKTCGGKIFVESRLGKGTIFTIYLPVARESKVHQQYKVEELPKGKERILLVDDEAAIAKMVGRVLNQLGYTVTTKTSSIETLELFSSNPNDFDLIISDMTMPKMNGDQLAIKLMDIRPDIPVIICTGYSKKLSEAGALEIGIKAFAHKPIVKEDLAKTVRDVLDLAKG